LKTLELQQAPREYLTTTGERLDYFIRKSGLKKKDFAQFVGISGTNVSGYISNRLQMSFEQLRKVYSLGCDTTWLITGKGEMYADNERGLLLERNTFQDSQKYSLLLNNNEVSEEEREKPLWQITMRAALMVASERQSRYLRRIHEILTSDDLLDVPDEPLDDILMCVCKIIYEKPETEPKKRNGLLLANGAKTVSATKKEDLTDEDRAARENVSNVEAVMDAGEIMDLPVMPITKDELDQMTLFIEKMRSYYDRAALRP
jgi:transcriptional regulator with XRE-family HTH domain